MAACPPSAKPGTEGLRDLLNEAYGSHTSYIPAPATTVTRVSTRKASALDYMLDYYDSGERAIAEDIPHLAAEDGQVRQQARQRPAARDHVPDLERQDLVVEPSRRRVAGVQRQQSAHGPHPLQPQLGRCPPGDKLVAVGGARHPGHSVTGDSFSDLVALKPDGHDVAVLQQLHPRRRRPLRRRPPDRPRLEHNRIIPADATGDGYTDLVALKPDGTMWLYSNNFVRDDGDPYGSVRRDRPRLEHLRPHHRVSGRYPLRLVTVTCVEVANC
ncbi:hypothetical protein LV779_16205 [Streptomyces thinghirensis]|nr:hypothetical protein [Streptomyces thinghirensis]